MAEGDVKEAAGALDSANEEVDLDSISDIPVEISAVLGRATMSVSQLLKLGRGAVVKLNRKVGEPIDIFVNNRLVARGEVVLVENKIGITLTEIIRSEKD
jgi:flagellar motor switch protein FliN/FliY